MYIRSTDTPHQGYFIDWGNIDGRYKQMKQYGAQVDSILDEIDRDSKLRVALQLGMHDAYGQDRRDRMQTIILQPCRLVIKRNTPRVVAIAGTVVLFSDCDYLGILKVNSTHIPAPMANCDKCSTDDHWFSPEEECSIVSAEWCMAENGMS